MLVSKNLLKSLISLLKSTDIFGSLLIEWNGKASGFQLKSKGEHCVYKARVLLSALYALLVMLQVIWTWENTSSFVKLHSVFMICGLQLNIYCHIVFCSKGQLIVSYLNGMLLFENHGIGKYSNLNVIFFKHKIQLIQSFISYFFYFQVNVGMVKVKLVTANLSK